MSPEHHLLALARRSLQRRRWPALESASPARFISAWPRRTTISPISDAPSRLDWSPDSVLVLQERRLLKTLRTKMQLRFKDTAHLPMNLWKAFTRFDADGSGRIERDEFVHVSCCPLVASTDWARCKRARAGAEGCQVTVHVTFYPKIEIHCLMGDGAAVVTADGV